MNHASALSLVKHSLPLFHKWLLRFLLLAVSLLLIGLYARPFLSNRTLMGNLEPFPDTFHYLVPAYNLAHGNGLVMLREGGTPGAPAVPPLYSLFLAPIFLFQNDPRWFYGVNIFVLSAAAFFLFKTVMLVTRQYSWGILAVFLFLTNHFIIWIPSLAMAESLLLFFFTYAVWLFIQPLTPRRAALMAATCIALYATKYAVAPLTLVFGIGYFLKIAGDMWEKRSHSFAKNTYILSGFAWGGVFSLLLFVTWQSLYTSKNILEQLLWQLIPLLPGLKSAVAASTSSATQIKTSGAESFFSLTYFWPHWTLYWKTLIGTTGKFLWDFYPLSSLLMGISAVIGTFLLLLQKKHRALGVLIIALLVAQTAFMSTFYTFDLRYVITHLPLLIIAACFAGSHLLESGLRLIRKSELLPMGSLLMVCIVILGVTLVSFTSYKFQIGLNLKFQETPWWQIAIQEHTAFFKQQGISEQKPILISASIPYHYDFFSEDTFKLLPLSLHQDFARAESSADQTWGEDDYSDLPGLYEQYLTQGRAVYTTNWGLGNEKPLHDDFAALSERFTLEKVQDGCLGACNLYQVKQK